MAANIRVRASQKHRPSTLCFPLSIGRFVGRVCVFVFKTHSLFKPDKVRNYSIFLFVFLKKKFFTITPCSAGILLSNSPS